MAEQNCNCNNNTPSIFKNDDTGAFGNDFIVIRRPKGLGDDIIISRVDFKCGPLPVMTFLPREGEETVRFPIRLNLTAEQTNLLNNTNYCYLKCYDKNGLGQTCEGPAVFRGKNREV